MSIEITSSSISSQVSGYRFFDEEIQSQCSTNIQEARVHGLENVDLSPGQINSFYTEGFLLVKGLFTLEEVSKISKNFNEAFDQAKDLTEEAKVDKNIGIDGSFRYDYDGGHGGSASVKAVSNNGSVSIKLISWIGGAKPELINLSRQEKVTVPVGQLLGSPTADHLINQAHYKKPGDGVSFPWHQDIQNRRAFDKDWKDVNGKGSFIQVLTAIDEVTEANGPIIIMENSHEHDLQLELLEDPISGILEKYPDMDTRLKPLLMSPGDTLFMHPLLLHKSEANNSSESRMMFINGFSYPGANKKPYPGLGSCEEITLKACGAAKGIKV